MLHTVLSALAAIAFSAAAIVIALAATTAAPV